MDKSITNQLNDTWCFWYSPRGKNKKIDQDNYGEQQKILGEFNTINQFFSYYCYLKRPSEIGTDSKLMLFRKQYKPVWEDTPNGGCWLLILKKKDHESLNKVWEILLFSLIGEMFDDTNIIGIVLSIREEKDVFEIWLSDRDEKSKMTAGEKICQFLNLDAQHLKFFFQEHQKSIKDNSIFKSAQGYNCTFKSTPLEDVQNAPNQQPTDNFKLE